MLWFHFCAFSKTEKLQEQKNDQWVPNPGGDEGINYKGHKKIWGKYGTTTHLDCSDSYITIYIC